MRPAGEVGVTKPGTFLRQTARVSIQGKEKQSNAPMVSSYAILAANTRYSGWLFASGCMLSNLSPPLLHGTSFNKCSNPKMILSNLEHSNAHVFLSCAGKCLGQSW